MNTLHALSASCIGEVVIFVIAVVFTVGSLVRFGSWLERGPDIARARAVAILLLAVFYCMAVGGIADFAIGGGLNVLNLGLFLAGAVGLAILTVLMLRNGRGRELRRMAALDL